MSSCISDAGIVNQRLFGARGLSMRGETIREHSRGGRPGTRPRHSTGPPREASTHATPCRKARTHAAKRERPGREARAFTLHLLARQFRARLLKEGRAKRVSNRRVGFRLPERARYPFGALEPGFRVAWRERDDPFRASARSRARISWPVLRREFQHRQKRRQRLRHRLPEPVEVDAPIDVDEHVPHADDLRPGNLGRKTSPREVRDAASPISRMACIKARASMGSVSRLLRDLFCAKPTACRAASIMCWMRIRSSGAPGRLRGMQQSSLSKHLVAEVAGEVGRSPQVDGAAKDL